MEIAIISVIVIFIFLVYKLLKKGQHATDYNELLIKHHAVTAELEALRSQKQITNYIVNEATGEITLILHNRGVMVKFKNLWDLQELRNDISEIIKRIQKDGEH